MSTSSKPVESQEEQLASAQASNQTKPPPPYDATQSNTPFPVQPYPAQPAYPIVQEYPVYVRSGEGAGSRFCGAFFVAMIIWLLSGMFIRSFLSMVHWHHHHHHGGPAGNYAIPKDLTLGQCVSGAAWAEEAFSPTSFAPQYPPGHSFLPPSAFPYSSQRTFELPLKGSDTVFLLSRGPMSSGTLDVVVSPQQARGFASVTVTVKYFREDVRDTARACLVARGEGDTGIGIFTPEWWFTGSGVDKQMYMEITIVLPQDESAPLFIKRFETDLPNTLHRIGDLEGKASFGSISLRGTNAAIQVKSLYMDRGSFVTKNGIIKGSFNASTSLTLKTTNSPIRIDVGLHNDGTEKHTPDFHVSTTNGPIDASISLLLPPPSFPANPPTAPSSPHYTIQARTTNSRLNIKFPSAPSAPLLTSLSLNARTTNAPAVVSLYPSFAGRFSLTTTNNGVEVHEAGGGRVEDGWGRTRRVVMERVRRISGFGRRVEGWVEWVRAGESGKGQGEREGKGAPGKGGVVDVRSQNALVLLEL